MSNWNEIGFAPQGWQCPVCGAVYSPMTPMCYNCTGKTKTFTVSTGTKEVMSIEEYQKELMSIEEYQKELNERSVETLDRKL